MRTICFLSFCSPSALLWPLYLIIWFEQIAICSWLQDSRKENIWNIPYFRSPPHNTYNTVLKTLVGLFYYWLLWTIMQQMLLKVMKISYTLDYVITKEQFTLLNFILFRSKRWFLMFGIFERRALTHWQAFKPITAPTVIFFKQTFFSPNDAIELMFLFFLFCSRVTFLIWCLIL